MKNKKSRIWVLLIMIMIINFAVFGLDMLNPQPEGGEYEKGVLRVWATWGDDSDHLQPLFDRYVQETGYPVKVASGVKVDQLESALAGDKPPDIVILSNNALVNAYYEQGLIEPLDSVISIAEIDLDDIYPAPMAQCEMLDGSILCLPWSGDVFALYWNKDLFEAAGLDPERPPQTMEEMLEYAEVLTIRDNQGELSQVGFIPDFPRPHTDLYVHMFDGLWYQDNGTELSVNAQPMIDALNWELQFYNQLGIQEANQFVSSINRYLNSGHLVSGGMRLNCQQCHRYAPDKAEKNPEHGFYYGRIAMMVDGEWPLGTNYIPNFNSELNFGVMPFPPSADHPEQTNSSIIQGPVAVIPSGGLEKEAAAQLLAWMMSPDVVVELAYATASLPTSRTAAQDSRFQQNPNFQVFMDLMSNPNTSAIVSTSISLDINTALEKVEKELLHKSGGDPMPLLEGIQSEFASRLP